ncbi:unnamed protein product [Prorocentrum cordatum]|uniref:Uncharacterized protein n=1 Tax=Prorocentrum cordatum TaxID=2364126 RepID=A0ABN9U4P7_9DINO|nr:unnamed protein product [Polarella glacialis]
MADGAARGRRALAQEGPRAKQSYFSDSDSSAEGAAVGAAPKEEPVQAASGPGRRSAELEEEERRRQTEGLRRRNAELEEESRRLQARCGELEGRCGDLQGRCSELDQALQRRGQELEARAAELEALREDSAALQAALPPAGGQYLAGPHFSTEFYSTVLGLVSPVMCLLGIAAFSSFVKDRSYQFVYMITSGLAIFLSMLDVVLFSRANLWFGIPDVLFVMGSAASLSVIYQMQSIPGVMLMSRVCPKNMQSTVVALLVSCYSVGMQLAGCIDAQVLDWFNVRSHNQSVATRLQCRRDLHGVQRVFQLSSALSMSRQKALHDMIEGVGGTCEARRWELCKIITFNCLQEDIPMKCPMEVFRFVGLVCSGARSSFGANADGWTTKGCAYLSAAEDTSFSEGLVIHAMGRWLLDGVFKIGLVIYPFVFGFDVDVMLFLLLLLFVVSLIIYVELALFTPGIWLQVHGFQKSPIYKEVAEVLPQGADGVIADEHIVDGAAEFGGFFLTAHEWACGKQQHTNGHQQSIGHQQAFFNRTGAHGASQHNHFLILEGAHLNGEFIIAVAPSGGERAAFLRWRRLAATEGGKIIVFGSHREYLF